MKFFILSFFIWMTVAMGETTPPFLHVIVSESPPYAYEESPNKWCGLTVDLWEQIAKKIGCNYDYVKLPPNEVMEALHTGKCDLCIAEMAPSIEAKNLIDFTEPYLASRLLVALRNFVITQEFLEFSSSLKSNGFIEIFFFMILGLLVFSILLWLVERKNNKNHFDNLLPHGVGSAFWFGAVTMTTNGYGDKVPVTFLGRSLTFVWMLAGMIFIALLTGTVISSLTIAADHASLRHIEDLARYKTGVFRGSYGAKTLKLKGLPTQKFENLKQGLDALCDKKIDAFVGDSISLQYLVSHDYPGRLRLASIPSGTIYRSIGLRPNLPQKREINNALLEITSPPEWNDRIQQWVGPMALGH
ncbi:MAG: transporter substrate-binding domain-containing protein [Chthoniobacterales bacterium]|nr:transporter substrate-binding domain-containing protein [Chthoniobacterales bacterium]